MTGLVLLNICESDDDEKGFDFLVMGAVGFAGRWERKRRLGVRVPKRGYRDRW